MRRINVTIEDILAGHQEGSVVIVTGTDEDSYERVTFAGDARPMFEFFSAVVLDKVTDAVAQVEDHQVLRVESNPEWDSPGTSPE